MAFFNDLDNRLSKLEMLRGITSEDLRLVERLFAVPASYDGFLDAWKEAEAVLQDGSEPGKT